MRAILLAGGLALIFTLLGTRVAIRVLVAKGYGQLIRDDGPTTHHTKRGTPTMGGLVIIISVLLAYALAKLITRDLPSWSGILLLFLLVGLGTVGFVDDYIKVAKQRSLGLRSKAKMAGQTIVAVIFGWLALTRPDDRGNTPASTAISFTRDLERNLEDLRADGRVRLHDLEVAGRELGGAEQDRIRDCQLADVVEERRVAEQVELGLGKIELAADRERELLHAPRVAGGVRVADHGGVPDRAAGRGRRLDRLHRAHVLRVLHDPRVGVLRRAGRGVPVRAEGDEAVPCPLRPRRVRGRCRAPARTLRGASPWCRCAARPP